ncbi:MAG: N-acetyltransferase [Chitinophagaceae bacterium]|jgi:UDP-2-acetamido-3-amino-2,3-dideoxy-glucuronate N-acetyltransferase|nr:N-acetyltransferase [Chitinophagaceae bacterium]OQY95688.1 MAG: N-acetyltransferase [Sphingobacteriales bacterium UTBCD1]
MEEKSFFVHASSVVDAGAQIGTGTKIWHFCHLMPSCKIGRNCNIGQNVFIDNNTIIGNGVKIQNNVSVYNGVVIEDGAFLGPSMVFTNVINPRSFIERKAEFKKTLIGKGATIGANATIICGVEIGAYSLIGAGAVVTKNVPSYALMMGNPARQKGWVSEAGLNLKFDSKGMAACPETGKVYKLENETVRAIS